MFSSIALENVILKILDELTADAYGEETHQRRMALQSHENTTKYNPANPPPSKPADRRPPHLKSLDRKSKDRPPLPRHKRMATSHNRIGPNNQLTQPPIPSKSTTFTHATIGPPISTACRLAEFRDCEEDPLDRSCQSRIL